MANLQYIGARYVPKLYDNPDDHSISWKSGVGYEPLTIVKYNDDTYTSRKPIPASVGNPADNPTYWAKTSDFNAALVALQNTVNDIQNDLETLVDSNYLAGKKVVVYGDSTVAATGNYMKIACDAVGATLTNRAVGGTRIKQGTNSGYTLISNSTDLATFDYLFLCYGTNDWQHSESPKDLVDDTIDLINMAVTKANNINIVFVTPFYSYRDFNNYAINVNDVGMTLEEVNQKIIDTMTIYNIPVVDFFHRSSCNNQNYDALLQDDSGGIYVHPTADFHNELASIVLSGAYLIPSARQTREMLNEFDFRAAQRAINNSVLDSLGGSKYIALVVGTSAITSNKKTFYASKYGYKYKVVGKASAAVTITIGSVTMNFGVGEFEAVFTLPFGFYNMSIVADANNTFLTDFMLFEYSVNGVEQGSQYRFGRQIVTTASGNITASQLPAVCETKEGLILTFGSFTVAADLANASALFTLPLDYAVDSIMVPLYNLSTGAVSAAIIQGQNITNVGTLPAGNYAINRTFIPSIMNKTAYSS